MTREFASALYSGQVTHVRVKPKVHRLNYRIYSLLLDLDELDELGSCLRWFSVDRFNLFSFHRKDRGDRSGVDLRAQVEAWMRAVGVEPDGGAIRLLTMPRILGWAFNPLSTFFCYRQDGRLAAILWEVDNTFGERHGYMIPVEPASGREIVQRCDKEFYVSPFMDMDLRYLFQVSPPEEKLSIKIETFDDDGLVLTARHTAHRAELTDAALLKAFLTIPFLTLRVFGGIHWEALQIWWKGIAFRKRPVPPAHAVSTDHVATKRRKARIHEPV
ncbi:MAG: DUF1365 family protein [Rhizobiaceae bacterium]|nr:DUF1365 family protein [Rhizobiaceae bacterium]